MRLQNILEWKSGKEIALLSKESRTVRLELNSVADATAWLADEKGKPKILIASFKGYHTCKFELTGQGIIIIQSLKDVFYRPTEKMLTVKTTNGKKKLTQPWEPRKIDPVYREMLETSRSMVSEMMAQQQREFDEQLKRERKQRAAEKAANQREENARIAAEAAQFDNEEPDGGTDQNRAASTVEPEGQPDAGQSAGQGDT
jgi:hypothetical protein